MLYIFRVDTGSMVTLDMGIALETVAHLKRAVESTCAIPQEKQVLLISGGESLETEERVCKYTAGSSDTNPIFLFSVASIESSSPPVSTIEQQGERDLQPEVESSLSLPDTHNTVAVRASLAQEFVKVSREQARVCESHILDQHLQHQGWAAALANLEDSVSALEKRFSRFKDTYSSYLEKREHFQDVIDQFDEDLHVLSKIPVLPALVEETVEARDSGHGSNGGHSGAEASSRPPSREPGHGTTKTLLDWINQAGNNSLESVADSCYRSLEQLDAGLLSTMEQNIVSCVEGGNNVQMKEIRGLGDRLSGLEQLLLDAKKKVTEQQDLAQAFLQNQARASGLRDTSILPDLCATHRQQLLVMMRNHQHILSIRKRCAKAKEELSVNLHTRLKWVMYIQRQMADHGHQLVLYHEELRRLSRRLEVMEQLHLAPSIYLATVVEVVRRRSFSQHYLKKAGLIAGSFGEVHAEETRSRQIFQEKLNRHFLVSMFQGMEDVPPDFATIPPENFDNNLPKITLQDLETLRAEFPNIAESLSMPDRNVLSSLLTKSFNQALTAEEGNALHNLQNMTSKIPLSGAGLASVSMMNRICDTLTGNGNGNSKKKSRLEALAASRDRRIDTDSDSDEDASNTKTRHVRKMSRSWTSAKSEMKEKKAAKNDDNHDKVSDEVVKSVEPDNDNLKVNLSSSSADPGSSSNANTNSSAAPSSDGSLLKNQWPSQSELHLQIEDKCREIERLRTSLSEAERKLEAVEARISKLVGVSRDGVMSLRQELSSVKTQVDEDRQDILTNISSVTKKMMDSLQELETLSTLPVDLEREQNRRRESETELVELKAKLETELHKLDDCHREIDIYRYQLEEANKGLDTAKEDMDDLKVRKEAEFNKMKDEFGKKIEELTEKFTKEKKELKQALELEHELELDNFKEKVNKEDNDQITNHMARISDLELKLKVKESEMVEELKLREMDLKVKEMDYMKQIEEKDKELDHLNRSRESSSESFRSDRTEILEAEFSEKLAAELARAEERLKNIHKKEMEELKESKNEEMLARMEEVRQKMLESSQLSVERMKTKLEKQQMLKLCEREEELKASFANQISEIEDAKVSEIEEAKEKVRKKSKLEIETLRSRFKIMQATGTMERSPSVSESEFPVESPRLGSMEHLGSSEERLRWDTERDRLLVRIKELQGEKDQYQQQLNGARSKEKLKSNAENQVMFNEAIRKVIEEKDKKIEDLDKNLKSTLAEKATLESNQMTSNNNQSLIRTLEDQLAEVQRKNAQLDSELREANQKIQSQMVTSFAPVNDPAESSKQLQTLQEENFALKQQLSKSVTSLISHGKVSVTSADKGDIVLVLWSDEHSNYQIYHEGQSLHFLHTESINVLGLGVSGVGEVRKKHITAEVVDKEYCQARKAENRFRVAQGTKFYRVKCVPVDKSSSSSSGTVQDNLASSLATSKPL